jgi:hypothetical protein
MPLSVTALADDSLRERLLTAAHASGHHLLLPRHRTAGDLPIRRRVLFAPLGHARVFALWRLAILPTDEAAANVAYLRQMLAQQNGLKEPGRPGKPPVRAQGS